MMLSTEEIHEHVYNMQQEQIKAVAISQMLVNYIEMATGAYDKTVINGAVMQLHELICRQRQNIQKIIN